MLHIRNSTGLNSTSSSPPPVQTNKSSGIIRDDVGIAIGCFIAGAAIAAIILLLLFRRQKKRYQQPAHYAHHLGPYSSPPAVIEKSPINGIGGVGAATKPNVVVSTLESYIPQPAEDDAITGEMSRLRDKIKNHAQTYYHAAMVDSVMIDESELQDISRATGIMSATLCDMLLNPRSRTAVIRMYLAWVILSRCGGQGDARASLLPPEVGLFVEYLAGADSSNAGQLALKSTYKSISGVLLQPRYSQFSDRDTRSSAIAQAISSADSVLRPFVSGHHDDGERMRNLQGIMQRAAQFAFLLFSQPSTWKFQWSAHGNMGQHGGFVVFPALLQTSNENAQPLNPARVFAEMEVA